MNNNLFVNPSEQPDETWESTVRDIARDMNYPAIPDIARRVGQRLGKPRRPVVGVLRVATVALLALMIVIVSVPEARAFVVEIFRIGAIQIFVGQPTATSTPRPYPTRTATAEFPPRYDIDTALDMPNETTLADAVTQLKSPVLLPAYPDSIGLPDHVYVQPFRPGVLVTLVWVKPDAPDQAWLTLDILNDQFVANKFIDNDGQYHNVKVKGTNAQWITGIHQIGFFGNDAQIFRKVNGNVLIWLVGKLTYRLEGAASSDEAIRIAESFVDRGTS